MFFMWTIKVYEEGKAIELTGDLSLKLKIKEPSHALSGTSKNTIYEDEKGVEYYLKEARPRKIAGIFLNDPLLSRLKEERQALLPDAIFNPYTETPEDDSTRQYIQSLSPKDHHSYRQLQSQIDTYVTHVQEVTLVNTTLEVLASRIAQAIMGPLLVCPEDYCFVQQQRPFLMSRAVASFHEFLSEHPLLAVAKTSDYWKTHLAPTFKDLNLTRTEAKILGQAYFIALALGHNDLVNNINLSNSGYVEGEDGSLTLCIVDWGNTLGVGFSGQTADEGAFQNPQFHLKKEQLFTHDVCDRTGYKHLVPFDEVVYPILPRQVIPDLFDITKDDVVELRQAQREGFYEACNQAERVLDQLPEFIAKMIEETLQQDLSVEEGERVRTLLPRSIFFPSQQEIQKDQYTLSGILSGRIKSLQNIKCALQKGKTLIDIADEQFRIIKNSQTYSSLHFVVREKSRGVSSIDDTKNAIGKNLMHV